MFCSAFQFSEWVTALEQKTEDIVGDDKQSNKTDTKTLQVFTIEKKTLWYIKPPDMYSPDPRMRSPHRMSVSEMAMHLWIEGL